MNEYGRLDVLINNAGVARELSINVLEALNATEQKYLFDVVKLVIMIDCLWFFKRGVAHDFYEKRQIDALNRFGRDRFCHTLFHGPA